MRRISWNVPLLTVLVVAGSIPLACAPKSNVSSGTNGSGGANAGSGGAGGKGAGGECAITCSGGGGMNNGPLAVTCDATTITVQNGASMPVHCTAKTGATVVAASWIVDVSAVAGVDANGTVTATGTQGGDVAVKATYEGETATATVTVTLKQLLNPAGTTGPDQATLQAASAADPGVIWAYPYNGTVFPKGLLAPEMQWNNGGVGDTYYVHLKGKYIDFEFYTSADGPASRFTVDDASWTQLTESGPGGKVALHMARLTPGAAAATVVADHTWTIANGSLRGTVYYWANSLGRVVRIKPGATSPDDFLAAAGQTGCTTCHAVAANGSTLIIGGDAPVSTFDLLTNTTVLAVTSVGKPIRSWAMPAISANGKVVVENYAPLPGPPGTPNMQGDGMWDSHTGAKIPGTGLDGVFLDMPSFGASGTTLAYVDHGTHALGIYGYDATTNLVTGPTKLADPGADGNLNGIVFPSVSPDAKWVVYHRGQFPNSLDTRFGPGDLYLSSVDAPGTEVRLAQINGDGYPFAAGARDLSYNYEPTFAPLNSGGFAWVVFTSRRTYGNELTGAKDVVKQLWVAAIDQTPGAGQDPSHPAFRVTGQDMGTLNMRGFWALDPCKQVGDMCGTGSECCNQNCDTGICKDPNPNTCSADGNVCMKDADCCDPTETCINQICSPSTPH